MNIRDTLYTEMQNSKAEFNPIFSRKNFLEELRESLLYAAKTLEFINLLQPEDAPKFVKVIGVEYDNPKKDHASTVEENKFMVAKITIDLCAKGERERKVIVLNVPFVSATNLMRINDIDYTPIFQMIDKGMYRVGDNLLLKTLLMPITLKPVKSKLSDLQTINVSLLKKSFNPLSVLPVDSYQEALDFYGVGRRDWMVAEKEAEDNPKFHCYSVTKKKNLFIRKSKAPEHVATVIADYIIGNKLYLKDPDDKSVQDALLTKLFRTRKNPMAISLQRCIDSSTQANLVHIADKDKESVHHVIRYMLYFFKHSFDGLHLNNKRVRLAEVTALPLVAAFSEASYRLLNSANSLTLNRLTRSFNIHGQNQDFLVSKMISSGLVRPISSTSSIQLWDLTKFTLSGTQGISAIPVVARQQHPSQLGQVGLHSTSVSDPGASGNLTPYSTISPKGFFDEEVDLITPY